MSLIKYILNKNLFKNLNLYNKMQLTTLTKALENSNNDNNNNNNNSNKEPRKLTDGELRLTNLLKEKLPNAKTIEVNDISDGCGSMYEVYVEAIEFKNMRIVKQHQLINDVLKSEVKSMHGIRIFTSVPE